MNLFASVLTALALTLALELLFALAWGVRKDGLLLVILMNVMTNPAVNVLHYIAVWLLGLPAAAVVPVLELVAFAAEGVCCRSVIRKPWLFAFLINAFSYGIGVLIQRMIKEGFYVSGCYDRPHDRHAGRCLCGPAPSADRTGGMDHNSACQKTETQTQGGRIMKRFLSLLLIFLLLGALTVSVYADAIAPQTPIDKMGEAGGPLLIILVLVVLPLALIVGVVYLTSWLIRKLVKKIRSRM